MKMIRKVFITMGFLLLLLGFFAGFYVVRAYGPAFGIYIGKQSPSDYLTQAVRFMDMGIYADTIEWKEERSLLLSKADRMESILDTYPLIEEGLKVAGGKHSRMLTKDSSKKEAELPALFRDENQVITIKLPAFMDGSSKEKELYVRTVHDYLKAKKECCGIILDLRGNTGGDAGPMLAAVAPLLPDGCLLSFDISGYKRDVILKDGNISGAGSTVNFPDFKLTDLPIAILQDDMTASSGEVVLLAFRGLTDVKTFGSPSAGYASCNTVKKLSDGSRILLTIGSDVTRTGEVFCEGPIVADVICDDPEAEALRYILSLE